MKKELTIIIIDALTGETLERPLTLAELAERETLRAAQEAQHADQDAKIAARQSALAKLAALGLTEDEIAAL
jgi:DNA-binding NarL/FixJ family response regulator